MLRRVPAAVYIEAVKRVSELDARTRELLKDLTRLAQPDTASKMNAVLL